MSFNRVRVQITVFFALVLFCILGSACGVQQPTTMSYIEYPVFFNAKDSYKTVVVGPVENAVDPEKYGQFIATNLVAKVQHNGAYKVIDASKGGLSEDELAEKGRAADPNALVLTSTITNYGEIRSTDVGSLGIGASSSSATAGASVSASNNGRVRATEYASATESRKSVSVPVLNFNRAMYAKLNVVLKRVSDGEIVSSEMIFAIASEQGMFGLNMSAEEERLKRALDDVTTNAVYYIAPSQESMKIEPDKILLIQKYGTEDWEDSSKFAPEDNIRVVFVISPRVAFNDFQITLKADGKPDPIDQQAINYSGAAAVFEYKAADLLEASGGVETYSVRLTYGNQTLSTKKFKIVVKK